MEGKRIGRTMRTGIAVLGLGFSLAPVLATAAKGPSNSVERCITASKWSV